MFDDTVCVTIFIVFNMLFAVVIGKCIYNFMFLNVLPVNVPSVKFVTSMLPKLSREIYFMVFTLGGCAIVLFICTPIFVFVTRNMFMFKGLCVLSIISIFYLLMFIHSMKGYEQRAMKVFKSKYSEYLKANNIV